MLVLSKKLAAAVAVAAAAAGAAAATQVAGATPNRPAAATVRLSAAKNALAFNVKTLHARHGKITLRMSNPSGLQHAVAVKGHKGKTVGKGGVSTVTLTLKKGRYTFFCPVPGHEAAGMKGTLIVS
jgi:plastocyanin